MVTLIVSEPITYGKAEGVYCDTDTNSTNLIVIAQDLTIATMAIVNDMIPEDAINYCENRKSSYFITEGYAPAKEVRCRAPTVRIVKN